HGERLRLFDSVSKIPMTLCFYVSPHKAVKDVEDMLEIFGDRKSSLVREISKVYQEVISGNLSVILERLTQGVKGELVLVVDGCSESVNDTWKDEAKAVYESGISMRDTVLSVSERFGLPKNEIKKYLLNLEE
ncbi:MAG: rRNA (cytidine-2'-O-)-methyltransferase, partial [Synergistaceae bacterium]|nr:rRNA (cytidine-2'-O-)-methyltransferase [Synergistaceae bacterium]